MKDIREMKLTELKQVAKSLHIKDWWTKKKAQLIEEIEELQNASTEELEAAAEEDEREKAAVEEYTRHWPKYTKRHNVREFLEKWRKGEIVLESEKDDAVEEEQVEEEAMIEAMASAPDLEEIMKDWPQDKKDAYNTHLYEDFVDTSDLNALAADAEKWSEEYDESYKDIKEAAINEEIEKEEQAHAEEISKIGKEELQDGELTDSRSEQTSDQDNINDQEEPENATENESEAQNDAPLKPKRGALIEYNGKSQNVCAWAKELGISANTLYGRLYKLGWTVEKAFSKK